ncbi:hypothetical protein [Shewanella sp. YIC-542]|uniref:hypothetical protein n=1 Tax=Shewanella mytili TaxID=3377111 RepID=UPI00398E9CBD
MNKTSLDEMLRQLPEELTPQRDLWPGIARRLDASEKTQPQGIAHWKQFAIACSLLLLGGVGHHLWLQSSPAETPSQMLGMMAQLQAQHQQQVQFLEQHGHYQQWQHIGLTAPISQGVDELRSASEQIYQALQKAPQDTQLWQLWLWTQQREIELLTQGQQLPETVYAKQQGTHI